MLGSIARKFFGTTNDRIVGAFRSKVQAIGALEEALSRLSDEELRARTGWMRERLAKGESLDDILVDAFATVREASKRSLSMRHFDVQLMGGMVLHSGAIAEMKTGEGKTLVATLAAYLNALEGKGVHIITVNDYLARRDAAWMGKIYNFLGLSVGVVVHDIDEVERQQAYNCDITYGTNNEFGFDYLRDNLKYARQEMVQRPFNFAIVDEVDSILVDEARTPLIISGPTEDNSQLYIQMSGMIPKLSEQDYEKEEKHRSITLTEEGVHHLEALLLESGMMKEGSGLYDVENISLVHHANQALRAHHMFRRDDDYIVKDNRVIIIDEFTGRMKEGSRYSDGLHQAIEAKERVPIQNENQTLASVTYQNYFRMYPKLAGMTGTAMTEAEEFEEIYKLKVVEMPTNLPVNREDHHDEIYRTAAEKYRAIVLQIAQCHKLGQPVLVGTVSIEKSEYLSGRLKDRKYIRELGREFTEQAEKALAEAGKKKGELPEDQRKQIEELRELGQYLVSLAAKELPIPHQVLNARYHEKEAHIIAQAGRPGAVTIATNMAGRGTDIVLGGNLLVSIAEQINEKMEGVERQVAEDRVRAQVDAAKQAVIEAGGLYVLGTERHESRRIDNQLRGRSGRQGDPGASKFFLSLEDDLLRIFGSERIDGLLQKMGLKEGEAIFHPWVNKAIEKAQEKVEQRNFTIRKELLKFDNVMNDQRKVIFEQRIEIIESDDISESIQDMRAETLGQLVSTNIPAKSYPEQWDIDTLTKETFRLFGLHLPIADWAKEEGIAEEEILERLTKALDGLMNEKEQRYGPELMRMAEKSLLLQTLDHIWKDHLHQLDHLKQGINLRRYGQRDPLNEYKREAFNLFEGLLSKLSELITQRMAHLEIRVENPQDLMPQRRRRPMKETRIDPAAGSMYPLADKDPAERVQPVKTHIPAEQRDPADPESWGKIGRNELCPCGSGEKYKHCHGTMA